MKITLPPIPEGIRDLAAPIAAATSEVRQAMDDLAAAEKRLVAGSHDESMYAAAKRDVDEISKRLADHRSRLGALERQAAQIGVDEVAKLRSWLDDRAAIIRGVSADERAAIGDERQAEIERHAAAMVVLDKRQATAALLASEAQSQAFAARQIHDSNALRIAAENAAKLSAMDSDPADVSLCTKLAKVNAQIDGLVKKGPAAGISDEIAGLKGKRDALNGDTQARVMQRKAVRTAVEKALGIR